MKRFRLFLIGLVAVGAMTMAGCGGSSSSGPGPGPDPEVPPPVAEIEFETPDVAPPHADSTFSAGVAISAEGFAVGYGDDGTGVTKGVRWDVTDPATAVVLLPVEGNQYSAAYGVADELSVGETGIVVGEAADANTRAAYWQGNGEAVLLLHGDLPAGPSAAYSINSGGEIVGEASDLDGNTVAVYWESFSATPLVLAHLSDAAVSSAYFIGDNGVIVGESVMDDRLRAVKWEPNGNGGFLPPEPMDVLDNNQTASVAFGVDFEGRVVGEAELLENGNRVVYGMLWDTDGVVLQSLAGASFQSINTTVNNRIVGYTQALSGGQETATIWNRADLNDNQALAPAFSMAFGINDDSQVVGIADNQVAIAVPVEP
ncbi:hypothetical protein [Geoalkalibacter halelectricus]|uniref:Extracellular repeat, HAF family n=1 Tax=Geoalkalibacter halelectricus TaxID=2847045 RepID=A0ABY5ZNL3_9BACT|nr:hypothetical protein [Geoalkalibacter halelectricus]MDO3378359.1 hypothetical protein [Geoalkalibacter halelectricus]UWZ80321.1 hypothetical protein L9S41_02700 [Geoalkalibacter halelectricus]